MTAPTREQRVIYVKPSDYQPSKAELEANISLPDATPQSLAKLVVRGGAAPRYETKIKGKVE